MHKMKHYRPGRCHSSSFLSFLVDLFVEESPARFCVICHPGTRLGCLFFFVSPPANLYKNNVIQQAKTQKTPISNPNCLHVQDNELLVVLVVYIYIYTHRSPKSTAHKISPLWLPELTITVHRSLRQ